LPALDVVLDLQYCVVFKAFLWFDGVLVQSSTYLLGSTTVYCGFPTSAARHSESLVSKDNISYWLPVERPCAWSVYFKVHYPGFWGGVGLTFDRLLTLPFFSVPS
jgi:hypothetical protein